MWVIASTINGNKYYFWNTVGKKGVQFSQTMAMIYSSEENVLRTVEHLRKTRTIEVELVIEELAVVQTKTPT